MSLGKRAVPSSARSDAASLRGLFERPQTTTFGAEEELMLLAPGTLDLAPIAPSLLRGADPERVKLELPASQMELVSAVHGDVDGLIAELGSQREWLAHAIGPRARPAAAGVHPFAPPQGELNAGEHYERMASEYGVVAHAQLVCGLHVHVGLPGADRALAVYNALRGHLPDLAALAANSPLYAGRDSGLASTRPLIAGLLPRQGVPPAYSSWQELAADLAWGNRAGLLSGSRGWWWELRLHPQLGTIEIRAPDAQSTVADLSALVATACALTVWLAERHDAGELGPPVASWRIAENRWSALRHGTRGEMTDLRLGTRAPTRERLHALLESLTAVAGRIGGQDALARAHSLVTSNGAERQREVAREGGPHAVAEMLAAEFPPPSAALPARRKESPTASSRPPANC